MGGDSVVEASRRVGSRVLPHHAGSFELYFRSTPPASSPRTMRGARAQVLVQPFVQSSPRSVRELPEFQTAGSVVGLSPQSGGGYQKGGEKGVKERAGDREGRASYREAL